VGRYFFITPRTQPFSTQYKKKKKKKKKKKA
jgi:hypothetical protein